MSISVTFYSNFSKRKNSTKQPTGGTSLNCVMKKDTSLLNPTFQIDGIQTSYNYCYFQGRYYFIDDITLNNNNIYDISCSIDALATYKSAIGSSTQFIERAASSYDLLVSDPLLSSQQQISNVAGNATQTFLDPDPGVYLIQTFSKSGVNVYAFTDTAQLTGILNNKAYGVSDNMLVSLIQTIGLNVLDISAYVSNPMWLPVNISSLLGNTEKIQVGFWELIDAPDPFEGKRITQRYLHDSGDINKPVNEYSDFRSYDPNFSKYIIYLPGCGTFSLPSIYLEETISYSVTVDIFTGNITYLLYSKDNIGITSLIGKYSGQVGVNIPYSTTKTDYLGLMQNILAPNIGGMGGDDINYAAIAKGVADTAFNVSRATVEPYVAVNSSTGNMSELKLYDDIMLTVTNIGSKEFPLAEAGRPLYEHKVINTLSGFVKCAGASLDIPGFESEKEMVNGFLNSGFYYE